MNKFVSTIKIFLITNRSTAIEVIIGLVAWYLIYIFYPLEQVILIYANY